MDRYSVKQPQNIIEKNPGEKLNEIYIAFTLSGGQLFSLIYIRKSCSINLV